MESIRTLCLTAVLVLSPILHADDEIDLSGIWKGEVTIPGQQVALIFEIARASDGKYSGTLLVPKQYPHKIPLTLVMLNDEEVTFDANDINGGFNGKLSNTGKRIKGEWEQDEYELPLTLKLEADDKKIDAIGRPQLSLSTSSYLSEEITFKNTDGYTLAGTLTRPKNPFRPTPAIILISDLGPHDQDSTIVRHKPFLVIADYLTKKGFTVLRYDDRGTGKSEADFANARTTDFVNDAQAALNYLQTRPEVDKSKLGIIGHGEGASVAAMVAAKREDVKYIVMMAGSGMKGAEAIISQNHAIGKASAAPPEFTKLSQRFLNSVFGILLSPTPELAELEKIGKQFEADIAKLGVENEASLAELGAFIENQMNTLGSPWKLDYLKYDPGPALEKVRCPVLAIGGDKDLQMISKYNLPEIEAHLKAGGNTKAQVRELKGMNHLFQECETGLPGKYGEIEQTISPRVLKGIGEWLISVNR